MKYVIHIAFALLILAGVATAVHLSHLNDTCNGTVVQVPVTESWWQYKCVEDGK